jgi:hypothetical protein
MVKGIGNAEDGRQLGHDRTVFAAQLRKSSMS